MRRTPALTKQARDLFEAAYRYGDWMIATNRIAEATGLSTDQVRDSVYSESADTWRRDMITRVMKEKNLAVR